MIDALVQLGIAAFGLTALWMAMGHNTLLRKWAPCLCVSLQKFQTKLTALDWRFNSPKWLLTR